MSPLTDQEFDDIDHHFAGFIEQFGGNTKLIRLAGTWLSRAVREGNICLPLASSPPITGGLDASPLEWPAVKEWRSALADSKAIGDPESQAPLVIDAANRLYLRRYWNYQERLGKALR